jgi:hypothetical protein
MISMTRRLQTLIQLVGDCLGASMQRHWNDYDPRTHIGPSCG